jgi:hypothetical protein
MKCILKISCPNNAGFVGRAKLAVFDQHGVRLGDTEINCPTNPPEPTTFRYIDLTGGRVAKTWTIDMTLTNTNNGHNASQVFNGHYIPARANESVGGQVTVDGVSLGGGTSYNP